MSVCAVIVAAGTGTRMGAGINKVYLSLCGKSVLEHTVESFANSGAVDEIVIVTGIDDIDRARQITADCFVKCTIVAGGDTRQQSVMNGITATDCEFVAVHDGARALVTDAIITETINAAKIYGAAAPAVPPKDTIKVADKDGFISGTVERESAYLIQTPQVFRREELIKAHRAAQNIAATDDCMLIERMGRKIKITSGSYENIKLTTPEDMFTAERILNERRKFQ